MNSASDRYRVELTDRARKDLAKIDEGSQARILVALKLLAENPRPPKSKRLTGDFGFRVRVGNYRIIYEILDAQIIVVVIKIGHRRDVYRDL